MVMRMNYLKRQELIKNQNNMVYFVCDRGRQIIDIEYAKSFYKAILEGQIKRKLHDNYDDAIEEMNNGFYDDSDYVVVSVDQDEVSIGRLEYKVGDYLYCIKDVIQESTGELRFTKGKRYLSESHHCLTNDGGNTNHKIGPLFASRHFILLKDYRNDRIKKVLKDLLL